MARDKGVGWITIISILIFLLVILIGHVIGTTAFTTECIIFIALTIFYYLTYEKWNMTPIVFLLIEVGHITHVLGTFGWYNVSPLPIGWERITHFFGAMPFGMLFFNYFKHKWDFKLFTVKNLILALVVFFAATGVGQLVETSEFWGYLAFGEGEGVLKFGHGDGVMIDGKEVLDVYGGGWINTGWDLTVNMIAVLFGLFLMALGQWMFRKKKEELDLYELEKLYLKDEKGYSQRF